MELRLPLISLFRSKGIHKMLLRSLRLHNHITGHFIAALTFAVFGCGSGEPWKTSHPVSGTVTYKGKPVKDAELAFFPLDERFPESVRPLAKTKESGEFVVGTYDRDDGAPAGQYKVTVVHHEIVVSKGGMGTKPNDLPKKYATKETTDLIIEVPSGGTQLPPFELK